MDHHINYIIAFLCECVWWNIENVLSYRWCQVWGQEWAEKELHGIRRAEHPAHEYRVLPPPQAGPEPGQLPVLGAVCRGASGARSRERSLRHLRGYDCRCRAGQYPSGNLTAGLPSLLNLYWSREQWHCHNVFDGILMGLSTLESMLLKGCRSWCFSYQATVDTGLCKKVLYLRK